MAVPFRSDTRITLSKSVYLYIAAMLLLLPFRLFLAIVFSAVLHEFFHAISLKMMAVRVHSIHVGMHGTVMQTDAMSDKEELLCALAGPLGGLLVTVLFRWFPVLALTSAVHAFYNLLPIYPSDGSRVLRSITRLVIPGKIGDYIVYSAEIVTCSAIVALCVYGTRCYRLGMVPILFAAMVIHGVTKTK